MRHTGAQPVHCGQWEGWGWWYDLGADPRTAPGMGVGVIWEEGEQPTQDEIDRARAAGREAMAAERVERPAAAPLELPNRAYFVWTGPLGAATAVTGPGGDPPSLVWPDDRSWFLGTPIYTNEIAVGGDADLVSDLLADPRIAARSVTPADVLDIDD